MEKVKQIFYNIVQFFVGVYAIWITAFGILWLGYVLSLDSIFGSTFDIYYMGLLSISDCDGRYLINHFILCTLAFLFFLFVLEKTTTSLNKRILFYSYLVAGGGFIAFYVVPLDWGGCGVF